MNRLLKYILLSIIVLIPYKVNATCSNNFKQQIYSSTNNISINYNLIDEEKLSDNDKLLNNRFKVTISGLTEDIIIEDDSLHEQYSIKKDESNPIPEGASLKFYYFYNGEQCEPYLIKTKVINIPYYNEFWNDEICENLTDFKYCKKTTSIKVDYDFLKKEVDKYKKKIENNNGIEIIDSENNIFNYKLLFIIVPILIVVITGIVVLIIKKKKRGKVLW